MPRPVTTAEVLLQQAVDVLTDIRDLLRPVQPDTTQEPQPEAAQPETVTEPVPGLPPKKAPAKKAAAKRPSKK